MRNICRVQGPGAARRHKALALRAGENASWERCATDVACKSQALRSATGPWRCEWEKTQGESFAQQMSRGGAKRCVAQQGKDAAGGQKCELGAVSYTHLTLPTNREV